MCCDNVDWISECLPVYTHDHLPYISFCSQDATEDFNAIHSAKAKAMLKDYYLGELVASAPAAPITNGTTNGITNGLSNGHGTIGTNGTHNGMASSSSSSSGGEDDEPVTLNPRDKVTLALTERIEVSHNARIFRFALPSPRHRLGLPTGRHLMVYGRDARGDMVARAYTPVSCDLDRGRLDLLVKVGAATEIVQNWTGFSAVTWWLSSGQAAVLMLLDLTSYSIFHQLRCCCCNARVLLSHTIAGCAIESTQICSHLIAHVFQAHFAHQLSTAMLYCAGVPCRSAPTVPRRWQDEPAAGLPAHWWHHPGQGPHWPHGVRGAWAVRAARQAPAHCNAPVHAGWWHWHHTHVPGAGVRVSFSTQYVVAVCC